MIWRAVLPIPQDRRAIYSLPVALQGRDAGTARCVNRHLRISTPVRRRR
jgi:hypothetical protein